MKGAEGSPPHLMHSRAHCFLLRSTCAKPHNQEFGSVGGINRVPEAGDGRKATTAQVPGMGMVLGTAGAAPWGWLPAR